MLRSDVQDIEGLVYVVDHTPVYARQAGSGQGRRHQVRPVWVWLRSRLGPDANSKVQLSSSLSQTQTEVWVWVWVWSGPRRSCVWSGTVMAVPGDDYGLNSSVSPTRAGVVTDVRSARVW